MQAQIICRCVIEEETEELGKKPLRHPPSQAEIDPLDNQLGYMG